MAIGWIEINIDNLPKNEVLAANFKPRTHGYKEKIVGYLYDEGGIVVCESDNEALENCTHYIDLTPFDL